MDIDALLDLDVVAAETTDHLSLLVGLRAPEPEPRAERAPAVLEVVLDRSGSMHGGPLDAAKAALDALVRRLDPRDRFGLVVFDDAVEVVVPAGPVQDVPAIRRAIDAIEVGGMTNLAGGLLRGIQEAERVQDGRGAKVVLLSDGHANHGTADPAGLGAVAAAARSRGLTVATIGLGLGYDEEALSAISRGGAGEAHFAEEPDAAGAALASEVDELLEQVVQAAHLLVRPSDAVAGVALLNDLAVSVLDDGFMVELGDFHAGEERRLLLGVDVPELAALGLAQVCELELRWTDARTLDAQVVTIPVHVGVVPGDEAAGRTANTTVRTERAFLDAQRAKREATDALRRGRPGDAGNRYRLASADLYTAAMAAPAELADELAQEADLLLELSGRAETDDAGRTAKWAEADRVRKERRRGKGDRPDASGDGKFAA